MAGANAAIYLFELLRIKAAAILLGPSGVGLLGAYQALLKVASVVTTEGLKNAGVRQIAHFSHNGKDESVTYVVSSIRRASVVLALLGVTVLLAGAENVSKWLFAGPLDLTSILLIGLALVIGASSGCEVALLQGTRRISELAITQVLSAAITSTVCILLYFKLGVNGIAPGLVVSAVSLLLISKFFTRKIPLRGDARSYGETLRKSVDLLSLGFALSWSGLLVYLTDAIARSLIVQEFGLPSGGLYQAAWSISGLFAGFIMTAMGSDFYPRLSTVINDQKAASTLINQQTEIGILLALPGLTVTICFTSEILALIYTSEFSPAAPLLYYFTLGIFGRVLSWPLGYIQLAKNNARSFLVTETVFGALYLGQIILLLHQGLVGVGQAFLANYVLYLVTMLVLAKRMIGFSWSSKTRSLAAKALVIIGTGSAASLLDNHYGKMLSIVIAGAAGVFSLRGLILRVGKDNPLGRRVAENRWLRTLLFVPK